MTYVKISGTEYPAAINGKLADREWGGRDSKAITLTMGYSEAVTLFVNGIAWSIVQRENVPTLDANGQPTGETTEQVSEFDNSDYSVAGSITDNRDGTVTCKMGRPTETETLRAEKADAELAAKILLGEAE
nr:MAG TPA: hypothetical protein [Caudoviricetes sp.]